MKKNIVTIHFFVLIGSLFFFSKWAVALDYSFQPRIENGIMSYSFEQNAVSYTIPTGIDDTSGYNQTQDKIEINTTMGFVGTGATLFVGRIFVDLSGQYTFEGSDSLYVSDSVYNETDENFSNLSTFTTVAAEYEAQIDRSDHAVSLGYAVTKRFSVFVGYKWAEVDIETTFDGYFSVLTLNNQIIHGKVAGDNDFTFNYAGPFVGVTHGWPIDGISILQGLISVNAGLAHLSSKVKRHRNLNMNVDSINGQDVEPIQIAPTTTTQTTKGDTLGLTLGLGWHGMTPWKDLSYSLVINAHRYQFSTKNTDASDTSETAASFKIVVTYVF